MSDTPRTDAAAIRCACSTYVVPSEFARELERENAALEEHIDRCERLLRCWCKPRTFGDAEDLREETKTFLNIKS